MTDKQAQPDFSANLSGLRIAKYLFYLRAETAILLPPWKGSAVHGGFGHALKQLSPFYYEQIFAPGRDGAQPKPFVIVPPLDALTSYPAGHQFTCELTLFGQAEQYFSICHAALEYLGREMGFGQKRGKFRIEQVAIAQPLPSAQSGAASQSLTGQEIAAACDRCSSQDHLTVHLPTRLRLKNNAHLVATVPEFHLFLNRLLGRINTLASLYGSGKVLAPEDCDLLLRQAQDCISLDQQHSTAAWSDLPRFSGRQQQWMQFGGLLGSITWQGRAEDFRPFLPFLAVGEWVHIGGKSSFGLGKYVLARPNNSV